MYAAHAPRLRGARIDLDIPTVTGTENLIMAAVLAEGITVIANAAREPHVFDLVRCLVGMGAHITGAGSELIVIEGQRGPAPRHHPQRHHRLHRGGHVHGRPPPPPAATWWSTGMRPSDVRWLINKLRSAGADVVEGASHVRVRGGTTARRRRHHLAPPRLRHRPATAVRRADDPGDRAPASSARRCTRTASATCPSCCGFGARISVEGRSAIDRGPGRAARARGPPSPTSARGAALVIAAPVRRGHHRARRRLPPRPRLRGARGEAERARRRRASGSPSTVTASRPRATSAASSATEGTGACSARSSASTSAPATTRVITRGEGTVLAEPSVVAHPATASRADGLLGVAAIEAAAADRTLRAAPPAAAAATSSTGARSTALVHHAVNRAAGRQRIFKPDLVIAVRAGMSGDDRRVGARRRGPGRLAHRLPHRRRHRRRHGRGHRRSPRRGPTWSSTSAPARPTSPSWRWRARCASRSLTVGVRGRCSTALAAHVEAVHGVAWTATSCTAPARLLVAAPHEERTAEIGGVLLSSHELAPLVDRAPAPLDAAAARGPRRDPARRCATTSSAAACCSPAVARAWRAWSGTSGW